MKLNPHNNSLKTNFNGESTDFAIGDASIIIDILRNRLYEHKIRTVVQEYICNARDAHREINQTKPFEVTLPNMGSLMFKVRDFGPGISPDRIANVFVKYGNSTKRTDNKQTGGFGIGAKSAWAYTDSFNVTTFIDHVKRVYVAHTGESNTGKLDLVSTEITDQPNGTEISFAIKRDDIREFENSVYRCVYFWDQKPTFKGILEQPEFKYKDIKGMKVLTGGSNGIFDYTSRTSFLLVDGIVYDIPESIKREDVYSSLHKTLDYKTLLFLPVEVGSLEIAASRESVVDIPKNKKVVMDLMSFYSKSINTYIKYNVNTDSLKEWLVSVKKLCSEGFVYFDSSYQNYKYNHKNIECDSLYFTDVTKNARSFYYKTHFYEIFNTILYYNDNGLSNHAINKRKPHLSNKTKLVFNQNDTPLSDEIIDALEIKKLSEVAEFISPKTVTQKSDTYISMTKLGKYGKDTLYPAKVSTKVVYILDTDMGNYAGIHNVFPDICFIVIAKSTVSKVKKYPLFEPITTWIKDVKLTKEQKQFIIMGNLKNHDTVNLITSLKTKDDFLNEMLSLYKKHPYYNEKMFCKSFNDFPEIKAVLDEDDKFTALIKNKYPLLNCIVSNDVTPQQEILFYINSKN